MLKIGIIGTGGIAGAHIDTYLSQPDVEVVAGADIIPGKAEDFFERFDVETARCYTDHRAMLEAEELDAVSVCTYNSTHAECAISALEHGLHVLLEKPMCVTIEEAAAIRRAEKASGKVLSIGFQPRFDPNMQKIKEIVESGVLGKIYYVQTGGGRRRGIPGSTFIEKRYASFGALGDIGCYSLDMVLNAIGYPKPLTVTGYTSDYFGKNPKYYDESERFSVDDFGAGFVRMEGGVILDFRISWAMHPDTSGDSLIYGTDGALRIPSTAGWDGKLDAPMTLYHDIEDKPSQTEIPLIKSEPGRDDLWDRKIRSFLDAILEGKPSPIPSAQIIYNQAIISGILESAALGREVALDIPEI